MIPWYQRDLEDINLEDANVILQDPDSRQSFPNQFKLLLDSVKERVSQLKAKAKEANPLAWVQPSYEQTLKLNCWIYGIDYIVDFDANRIGKTAGAFLNLLLWEIPNQEDWMMFRPHTDHLQRTFQTVPRPPISALKEIRTFLKTNNLNHGNPKLPLSDFTNLYIYQQVALFLTTKKFPPQSKRRTIWVGGPDHDFNKDILFKELLTWTPPHIQERVSIYDASITLRLPHNKAQIDIIFKSYDSDDTKWSGSAVDAILLSEGVPQDVYNEVKQRYKYPAYGSWDYTPYEPRNTHSKSALAYRVFKDPSILPLSPFIFSGFGIKDAPNYILPDEKKADLIKNWQNDPQGDARIRGIFYSSSPVILKNYKPHLHALHISFQELKKLYAPRPLILFRGLDPGWGHVTACAWMALAPDNTKYIYRFYAEKHRSIEERCQDIITQSGNERLAHPKNKGYFYESPTSNETRIRLTWIDYHTFKTDENTGIPFANNYIRNGLIVRPSITLGPKERATMLDDMLQSQPHLPHPISLKPPGGKLFFLINEPGVAPALQRMENLFWMTFEKGEKRGLSKDTVQDYDDDELDATCYVTLPQISYQSFFSPVERPRQSTSEGEHINFSNIILTPS